MLAIACLALLFFVNTNGLLVDSGSASSIDNKIKESDDQPLHVNKRIFGFLRRTIGRIPGFRRFGRPKGARSRARPRARSPPPMAPPMMGAQYGPPPPPMMGAQYGPPPPPMMGAQYGSPHGSPHGSPPPPMIEGSRPRRPKGSRRRSRPPARSPPPMTREEEPSMPSQKAPFMIQQLGHMEKLRSFLCGCGNKQSVSDEEGEQ